jgi:hypothetical protein
VPEISRFFGLVVLMFYNDHAPPHFHVRYGGQRALIGIEALAVLEGRLTPKALGLIVEWASMHQEELRADWERARRQEPLQPIAPLE